jgi:hypothetical protein
MKSLNLILFSFLLMMSSCNAQNKKDTDKELSLNSSEGRATQPSAKPDVRFKVNKQFDEKGNLIGYDSTYTYSFSGAGQNDTDMKQIFDDFPSQFDSSMGFFKFPGRFSAPRDSTYTSPFNDAYFQKQLEFNDKLMQQLLQHFNSLKDFRPENKQDRLPGQKHI